MFEIWNAKKLRFVGNLKKRQEAMKALVGKFWQDECGATAIEYGLIAAGISLAIIAAVNGLGTTLNEKFTSINSSLK
jgi:pilus assembly protein Flp/PilA